MVVVVIIVVVVVVMTAVAVGGLAVAPYFVKVVTMGNCRTSRNSSSRSGQKGCQTAVTYHTFNFCSLQWQSVAGRGLLKLLRGNKSRRPVAAAMQLRPAMQVLLTHSQAT
jgi:hypothetical protein